MISKNKLVEYLNDTIEHNSKVLTDLQNKREDAKEEYWKVALESLQRETQIRIWFANDLVDMIEQGEFEFREATRFIKLEMINKYVKKPIVIKAIQFTRENAKKTQEWLGDKMQDFSLPRCLDGTMTATIKTLEGNYTATENDYIIQGIKGEFYPCKPDIFKATYQEEVE